MKQAVKATALVLFVALLCGCSNPEAKQKEAEAKQKAAVAKQKVFVCDMLSKDLSTEKVLVSDRAVKGFNDLAKIDPYYTELAQQAFELNMITQLSKAGIKGQDSLSRSLTLYAKIKQFCA